MKVVNPYTCDCQALVVTYELRRRGYDLMARPALMYQFDDPELSQGFAVMMHAPNLIWYDPIIQTAPDIVPVGSIDQLAWCCQLGERYHLMFDTPFSTHIINVERDQELGFIAYDPAGGSFAPAEAFFSRPLAPNLCYQDLISNLRYYRVDHCEIFPKLAELLTMRRQDLPDLLAFSPLKCWGD